MISNRKDTQKMALVKPSVLGPHNGPHLGQNCFVIIGLMSDIALPSPGAQNKCSARPLSVRPCLCSRISLLLKIIKSIPLPLSGKAMVSRSPSQLIMYVLCSCFPLTEGTVQIIFRANTFRLHDFLHGFLRQDDIKNNKERFAQANWILLLLSRIVNQFSD